MKNLKGLSYCLRTGSWPIRKAVSTPVVVWSFFGCFSVVFRLFGTLKPNQSQCYNGWTQPPVCLPSVYLMSLYMTKSPRLSPSVFTCSNWVETGGRNGLGMRLYVYSKSLTRSAVIRSLKVLNDSRAAGGSAGLCFLNHAIDLWYGCTIM